MIPMTSRFTRRSIRALKRWSSASQRSSHAFRNEVLSLIRLQTAWNGELADQLRGLASRVLALIGSQCGGVPRLRRNEFTRSTDEVVSDVLVAWERHEFHSELALILGHAVASNSRSCRKLHGLMREDCENARGTRHWSSLQGSMKAPPNRPIRFARSPVFWFLFSRHLPPRFSPSLDSQFRCSIPTNSLPAVGTSFLGTFSSRRSCLQRLFKRRNSDRRQICRRSRSA